MQALELVPRNDRARIPIEQSVQLWMQKKQRYLHSRNDQPGRQERTSKQAVSFLQRDAGVPEHQAQGRKAEQIQPASYCLREKPNFNPAAENVMPGMNHHERIKRKAAEPKA